MTKLIISTITLIMASVPAWAFIDAATPIAAELEKAST